MPWAYLFASDSCYPEPLQEVSELGAIANAGRTPYLLLNERSHPPMCAAIVGEVVYMCTRTRGTWRVHGTAHIAQAGGRLLTTPPSVIGLYGQLQNRWWQPLEHIHLFPAQTPEQIGIVRSLPVVGQANVFDLGGPRLTSRLPPEVVEGAAVQVVAQIRLPQEVIPGKQFVGVDLTAGTWQSHLDVGTRDFPVVEFVGTNDGSLVPGRITTCATLGQLLRVEWALAADRLVIDGPCQTNGIPLLNPPSGWDFQSANPGYRLAERQLAAKVGLFWTTLPTLQHFDGASRWIARSVHLFAQPRLAKPACIETHPHGVFVILQRMLGTDVLAPKRTQAGRSQRLAILSAFVPSLDPDQLPSHDHVDAAAAALLGALQYCGSATKLGDVRGGYIWVPSNRAAVPFQEEQP